jgi:hypothetical protein
LFCTTYDAKLTSPSKDGSNIDAMNALISHRRVGRPRLWVAWVLLFSRAVDGALEGVPINVLSPEEDVGDGGRDCERVARGETSVGVKDLMRVRELFSEEDVGDGGDACSHIESLDGCRGLVDLLLLLSEDDMGDGGGAREPLVR